MMRAVATRVYIDGEIFGPEEARIPVWDRGFLYGDSVYEVTRTFGGKPFALADHLTRLEHSAAGIGLALPPRATLTHAIAETLRVADNPESYIRLIVTRGAGDIGLDPALADQPRLIVIVRPTTGPDPKYVAEGVDVAIVSVRRNLRQAIDPSVKSGNYLNNVLAVGEARRRFGAYEALMCDAEGRLAECSTANIFLVKAGRLRTPALDVGILHGITRQKVIELAQGAGIPVDEGELWPADLRDADEALLTSSVRGVLAVVKVDGQPIGEGRPGPVTRRLMSLYDQLTRG
jgi:branched-chain amino acid aminotransferase